MNQDYRKSHLAPGKGSAYHDTFEHNPFRAMVWAMEQRILDRIAREQFQGEEISHLDVACGTGRILQHLGDRAGVSVGIDIAPGMLEIARQNCLEAEIIEADITAGNPLGNRKFNLITAFRFFPNAEPELRAATMAAVAEHLDTGGWFVFNNHRNPGSTRYRLARLTGRGGLEGMSRREAESMVRDAGLEIVKVYHLNVLPASETRLLLPVAVLRFFENILSGIPLLRNLGENLIFVCRRSSA